MTRTRAGSVTLIPPGEGWTALVREPPDDPVAHQFREQIGLASDRPIVMGGHQAGLWHAGILAKYFAVQALARKIDAQPAWLVVDHDINAAHELAYPARDAGGRLRRAVWDMSGGTRAAGSPTALAEPVRPVFGGPEPADERIAAALARIGGVVAGNAEGSLARQMSLAVQELLEGVAEPMPMIFSSHLARTDLFAAMVSVDEAARLRETYNDAVERFGGNAGVRALRADTGELPVWSLSASGRVEVTDRTLTSVPRERLAPRALLMTGLVRLAGCDLFVHGTGGGDDDGYDRVAEAWFDGWLDRPPLAPSVVATATLTLDFGDARVVSEDDLERAKRLVHSAKHDPEVLGDAAAGGRKRELVERAQRMKDAGENPAPVFAELQRELAGYRERHADEIARLGEEARTLEAARRDTDVLTDRTWAFALFPERDLRDLRDEIDAAF